MQTRQARVQSNRNSVIKQAGLMELYKLQQNVVLIAQRNKMKYAQILSDEVNFNVLFYQPNDKLKTQKAFKKQLLLKQLDKLMDQESIFDKKLAQIKFLNQLESQEQDKMLDKELNPYQALRTVWARHQKTAIESKNSADRLQSLNWTTVMIKNTVMAMKQKEQHFISSFPSQTQSLPNKNYEKLLLNYNRSLMENQQLRQEIQSLYAKIQAKQQVQNELQQKLVEKQKEIKNLKRIKELAEVDQKFVVAHLKQEIFQIQKKLQKLQKWKHNLEKSYVENIDKQFKCYFEIHDHNHAFDEKLLNSKTTTKNLSEIFSFLTESSNSQHSTIASYNNSQFLNLSSLDQQNSEIIIPSLSLTETDDQSPVRKKMPTERPLKTRNFEFQKFVGNKLVNLKFSKLPTPANLNDETMKKFVRKNPVLGTSRRLEPQYSERYLEPIQNSTN